MSNWKVGPGGRLYHPTTGAYVGQLDLNGNEQMVLGITTTSDGENVITVGGNEIAPGYDVWLVAGQSNSCERGVLDTAVDVVDPRVDQYACDPTNATFRKIVSAIPPLYCREGAQAGKVGPLSWFGRAAAQRLPAQRRILLVPAGVGTSSLVGGTPRWNMTGDLYLNAISQANAALAQAKARFPASRFAGIYWAQGEEDANNSVSRTAYRDALISLIAGFRASISGAANAPVLIAGMVPEAISVGGLPYRNINLAHQDVAAVTPRCVFVPGVTGFCTDNSHYNVGDGPRRMGAKVARYIGAAVARTGTSIAAPQPVSNVSMTGTTVTWDAPTSGDEPTDYTVRWRLPAGSWTTVTKLISQDQRVTIPGLSAGTAYEIGVTATNIGGSSVEVVATLTPNSTVIRDWETDALNVAPFGVTRQKGTMEVSATGISTWGRNAIRHTGASIGDVYAASFDDFAIAANQRVTWRRGASTTGVARDGMMLRANLAGVGTVTGDPAMAPGYFFNTAGVNGLLRVYKVDAAGLTLLGAAYTLADAADRFLRASVIGNALLFEFSADGVTWTTAVSVTDSTYSAAGSVQWCNGLGGTNPDTVYIDSVQYEAL